jgi:hypothetical protein
MHKKELRIPAITLKFWWPDEPIIWRKWLPSRGNVLFTLLVIGIFFWAQNAGAISLGTPVAATASTASIPYQGRLADKNGAPLTQTVNMIFRLYTAAGGGSPLWEEQWTGSNSVQMSDGLFNVMLGSLTPIPQSVITGNSNLFLGFTVGTDSEMSQRVQLGSVPFATQALTVPDGSITKAKLAADVSLVPPDGSITTPKLANGAVTKEKLAGGLFGTPQMKTHVEQFTYNSTAWADISSANLSLTINSTEGQKWLIICTIPSGTLMSDAPGWSWYDIAIDNQRVSGTEQGLANVNDGANYEGAPITMVWLATLSAGEHTIRPQWRAAVAGDSVITNSAAFTIIAVPF